MPDRILLAGLASLALAAVPVPVVAAGDAEALDGDTASPAPASEIVIAAATEPGQPLYISGSVSDAASASPIEGAHIVVYQTDEDGEYEPADPTDESTARLHGEMTTDADGHFAFDTILPGEYPDAPPGNRHIHVHSVTAEGYAPQGFVVLFDDNVRDEVRTWAEQTGFGRVIELTEEDGQLIGSLEITLEASVEDASPEP